MSDARYTTCPHCGAHFQVAEEQLKHAHGRVRCGSCLQIFDGITGDIDFIPPVLPSEELSHPVSGLNVAPMAAADLPETAPRTPWLSLTALLGLLVLLGTQVAMRQDAAAPELMNIELSRITVRAHPDYAGALRIDAMLRNTAATESAYPLLTIGFTNRQGEPRARRTFLPVEYLHGEQPLRIPPRSELQVSLAIADPGPDAVNYLARLESATSITR